MKNLNQVVITIKPWVLVSSLLILSFFFGSCEKESSNGPANSTQDTTIAGEFYGTASAGSFINDIEGTMEISQDGKFTLQGMTGRLTGAAVKSGNEHSITITNNEGSFEGMSNISGEYSTEAQELVLNGTNAEGSDVAIQGEVKVWSSDEWNQNWRDKRSKSSVYFTHNETCGAIITIENETLDTLFEHWWPGAYCDAYYDNFIAGSQDVDGRSSNTFCSYTKLKRQDGSFVQSKSCPSARFVLDKNTTYTYFVEWTNGATSSGQFTSPDGGQKLAICIENGGDKCSKSGGEGGSARITKNTLEIDQNYALSANDGYTEGHWTFNFDDSDLSIRPNGELWIGHVAWSSYSFIRFYNPSGITPSSYNLDTEDDVELNVVDGGDKQFYFHNDWGFNPHSTSKGTITVNQFNMNTKTLSITFDNVALVRNVSPWQPTEYMRFSGTVEGTFE